MNYMDYFPTFAVLEPTLLPEKDGFVVSQVEVDNNIQKKTVGSHDFIENGVLVTFSSTGKLTKYTADSPLFIHYDDELVYEDRMGRKYYAEEVNTSNEPTYIRCIRLVPGAEWNSSIAPSDTEYAAAIAEGKIVKVGDTTFPDGTVGYSYRCIK